MQERTIKLSQIQDVKDFVSAAGRCDFDIDIFYNRITIDAKSILGVLSMDLTKDLTGPTLLLSHRPEYIDVYSKYDVNLVFSGHAHGGQFILPFVGSVYSTDQGLFPELTRGKHEKDGTTMIISRGLGNLAPVPRLFNYPEIVVVTLHSA